MKTAPRLIVIALIGVVAPLSTPASVSAEIIRVEFAGVMDFSMVGGSAAEAYSGTFLYDTAIPPDISECANGVCYASYLATAVDFRIFGTSVIPSTIDVYIQDNAGSPVYNDFFTLTLLFGANGLVVRGTNRIMDAMGVNAGAYPATMFSSTAFPRNLDVLQASTSMNDYAQLRSGLLLHTNVPPAVSNVVFTPHTPPGAPTNFQATVAGNTVNMSWDAPASGTPTGYRVVARTTGGQLLATVQVGNVNGYSASAPNGIYALSVLATNSAGAGPESNSVVVTVPQAVAPPGAPSNLTVSVSGDAADFSWDPPSSGGAVANYLLVAGTTPGFAVPVAVLTLAAVPGVSIPGIPPGTYYVRILAMNTGGTSAPSNEVELTVTRPVPPGAPTLDPAFVSGNTVSLTWTPGAGGAPTSYVLTASVFPGGSAVASVTLTGTSATFTGVQSGTYFVRLAAANAAGTGPPSNEITVVVP